MIQATAIFFAFAYLIVLICQTLMGINNPENIIIINIWCGVSFIAGLIEK